MYLRMIYKVQISNLLIKCNELYKNKNKNNSNSYILDKIFFPYLFNSDLYIYNYNIITNIIKYKILIVKYIFIRN